MAVDLADSQLVEAHFDINRRDGTCSTRYVFDTSTSDIPANDFAEMMEEDTERNATQEVEHTVTATVDGENVVVWKHLENKEMNGDDFDLGALLSWVSTPVQWWFGDKPRYAGTMATEVHDIAAEIQSGCDNG